MNRVPIPCTYAFPDWFLIALLALLVVWLLWLIFHQRSPTPPAPRR